MTNRTIKVKSTARTAKILEDRATRAFYSHCNRVPVPIAKLGLIQAHGVTLAATEPDDQALGVALRAFVDTLLAAAPVKA